MNLVFHSFLKDNKNINIVLQIGGMKLLENQLELSLYCKMSQNENYENIK